MAAYGYGCNWRTHILHGAHPAVCAHHVHHFRLQWHAPPAQETFEEIIKLIELDVEDIVIDKNANNENSDEENNENIAQN